MSGHVATGLDLTASPPASSNAPLGTISPCDNNSPWSSNDDSNFTVEELSDTDQSYPGDLQVLHPYELEEAESGSEQASAANSPADDAVYLDNDDGEDTQGSNSTIMPRQLRQLRWHTGSGPVFASPSPTRSHPRKRLRSEAPETDTESDGVEGGYAPFEPPRLRRRIESPKHAPLIGLKRKSTSEMSDAPPLPTRPTWVLGDPMEIDSQATSAS